MYNTTIHQHQSDTIQGQFVATAGENLAGKEAYVVSLSNDSGKPVFGLAAGATDPAEYLLLAGGSSGAEITVLPLTRDRNVRVVLSGTCDPGDLLILDGDTGKVKAVPSANGTYIAYFRAEESGVDGQLLKVRWIPAKSVVVSG